MDNNQHEQWVERVATFCVDEWGLPPITGRILGLLLICDPAEQSAAAIADAIQASRASLTGNMRILTTVGLVRKVRRPGDRTAYYRIEDDAWQKVIRRKLDSLGAFGAIADDGLAIAGPAAEARIRSARDSFAWLRDIADGAS
ncbi:GbsR/MarR family transcriptional regulator [Streptomyces sp. NPDC021093]|uniref:GbsR/MarR family transcriptional regulator n=1 Tax=Streptomyces sp. NPDC021093 TaxID=3365112 RepID=UPI003793149C